MNFKEIKELIKLIDNSGLTEFHYEKDDIKLTLKKEKVAYVSEPINVPQRVLTREELGGTPNHDGEDDLPKEENLHIVKSPIVGVFYASKGPDADPFVKPGDQVKNGQVLCIVEAMKLMNEITSDADGELVEVLVSNQGAVEYGQPLFSIRKR